MHSSRIRLPALVVVMVALAPAAYGQTGSAGPDEVMSVTAGKLRIERLATFEFPWGMALLPDGGLLITEKPGRLRIWDNGKLSDPIAGVPEVVYRGTPGEQGGLLDVEIDPDFERDRLVYLSYTEGAEHSPRGSPRPGTCALAASSTWKTTSCAAGPWHAAGWKRKGCGMSR